MTLAILLPPAAQAQSDSLRWGRVSNNPKKASRQMQPMADHLAKVLRPVGVGKVELVFRDSLEEMIELFKRGEVDFIAETLYPAVRLEAAGVARAILLEYRDNTETYHSVFIARKNGGVKTLGDLNRTILALEDPGSTSGYFLPRQNLQAMGFSLREMDWPGARPEPPADADVGYIFAQSEKNIPVWVAEGRVHAGAFSNENWQDDEVVPPALREQLMVIHSTPEQPRALLLVRAGLAEPWAEGLRQALLKAIDSPEGLLGLQEYRKVKAYAPLPDAVRVELDRLRDQHRP